jgi:hypothetical protein
MPSSGRYQSQIFSFLSQRSLQFKDKAGQALRQIKVAAAWSAQILLYPVYAGFQAVRLIDRQIKQAAQAVFPQLRAARESATGQQPLSVDTPIQKTLQSVSLAIASTASLQASTPSTLDPNPLDPNPLEIQGIAADLLTKHLVLVTPSNECLDILTSEQQFQLQKYMVLELANYARHQQLRGQTKRPELSTPSGTFLPLPKERETMFLPVRIFRRVMTWMQISPIAMATNLFQETKLVPLLESGMIEPVISPSWRSHPLLPGTSPLSRSDLRTAEPEWRSLEEIRQTILTPPNLSQNISQWLQPLKSGTGKVVTDVLETVGLIYTPPSLPTPMNPDPSTFTPPDVVEPWLTMEDLFGNMTVGNMTVGNMTVGTVIVESSIVESSIVESSIVESHPIESHIESQTVASQTVTSQTRRVKSAHHSVRDETASSRKATAQLPETAGLSVIDTTPEESSPTFTAPWIETEAKLVQYEQHPLERLLKWLDERMLWMESRVTQLVKWIGDRLNSN